ncbi:MAG: hypothetical protein FRX48_09859 [Lasallia pustulata]|uniref:Uncharacterized protein n=1 Tax=Lasallia pustulata TaxID=136370 RepID=A0A5M8PAQ3_9LECA|nr:MAG: hypothetical protein FRX48_09859 [Lasallia pustulata]
MCAAAQASQTIPGDAPARTPRPPVAPDGGQGAVIAIAERRIPAWPEGACEWHGRCSVLAAWHGRQPRHGFHTASSATPRPRSHKPRVPGTCRSRQPVHAHPCPPRRASHRATGVAVTRAAVQMTVSAWIVSAPSWTVPGWMAVTSVPARISIPMPARSLVARADKPGAKWPSTRDPASIRTNARAHFAHTLEVISPACHAPAPRSIPPSRPRSPAADQHKTSGSRLRSAGSSCANGGAFERVQDAPPERHRVLQRLQAWRGVRPVMVAEVAGLRPCGDHQAVVRHRALAAQDLAGRGVDARHRFHQHLDLARIGPGSRAPERQCRPRTAPPSQPGRAAAETDGGCADPAP